MVSDKHNITTDKGEKVEATAPVIISASRSTDIPAFYAKWFFNRLAKGYCTWYNPFNINQKMYISFERCKVIVFWTKNPAPIIPYLPELDKRGIHYYFQVTLNDYVKEGFEPNVPSVEERVETFKALSNLIGKEKVIWRFDPLIITPSIGPRELLTRIWTRPIHSWRHRPPQGWLGKRSRVSSTLSNGRYAQTVCLSMPHSVRMSRRPLPKSLQEVSMIC